MESMWLRVLKALVAVVAGNAVYFLVLMPRLPETLRHRPYALDAGLALDFAVCLVLYALLTPLGRRCSP